MKISHNEVRLKLSKLNSLVSRVCEFTYNTYGCKYVIMCEGNILSNCMCIAEAPGAQEEEYKRILIGKSGNIIRNILKKYGIENKIMFLNVIPWRPNFNSTPKQQDILNYIVFWEELFQILHINHVVCLGSVAKKMMKIGNSKFCVSEILETWHPAYYLRTNNNDHLENIDLQLLKLKHNINCFDHYCYMHFVREII